MAATVEAATVEAATVEAASEPAATVARSSGLSNEAIRALMYQNICVSAHRTSPVSAGTKTCSDSVTITTSAPSLAEAEALWSKPPSECLPALESERSLSGYKLDPSHLDPWCSLVALNPLSDCWHKTDRAPKVCFQYAEGRCKRKHCPYLHRPADHPDVLLARGLMHPDKPGRGDFVPLALAKAVLDACARDGREYSSRDLVQLAREARAGTPSPLPPRLPSSPQRWVQTQPPTPSPPVQPAPPRTPPPPPPLPPRPPPPWSPYPQPAGAFVDGAFVSDPAPPAPQSQPAGAFVDGAFVSDPAPPAPQLPAATFVDGTFLPEVVARAPLAPQPLSEGTFVDGAFVSSVGYGGRSHDFAFYGRQGSFSSNGGGGYGGYGRGGGTSATAGREDRPPLPFLISHAESQLAAMGFVGAEVPFALQAGGGSVERAVELLLGVGTELGGGGEPAAAQWAPSHDDLRALRVHAIDGGGEHEPHAIASGLRAAPTSTLPPAAGPWATQLYPESMAFVQAVRHRLFAPRSSRVRSSLISQRPFTPPIHTNLSPPIHTSHSHLPFTPPIRTFSRAKRRRRRSRSCRRRCGRSRSSRRRSRRASRSRRRSCRSWGGADFDGRWLLPHLDWCLLVLVTWLPSAIAVWLPSDCRRIAVGLPSDCRRIAV